MSFGWLRDPSAFSQQPAAIKFFCVCNNASAPRCLPSIFLRLQQVNQANTVVAVVALAAAKCLLPPSRNITRKTQNILGGKSPAPLQGVKKVDMLAKFPSSYARGKLGGEGS